MDFKGCIGCYPNKNLLPGEQIGTICESCRIALEMGRRAMAEEIVKGDFTLARNELLRKIKGE